MWIARFACGVVRSDEAMKQGHRTGWALVAAITLVPVLAVASPGAGSASRPRAGRGGESFEAGAIGGCARVAQSPRRTGLPPVTHRPGTPGAGALEARRHDPRGPHAPTSGWLRTASRRDRSRVACLAAATRDGHVVAPAAAFHDAHAPPHGLLAVAGCLS